MSGKSSPSADLNVPDEPGLANASAAIDDQQLTGPGGGKKADRFRIKIRVESNVAIICDNKAGAADTAELDTDGTLVQGSIVIHSR